MTEKMKPSGIAWIGDIPQSWKISRLKYNITCLDEQRIPVDAALRNPGPYPYWGAGNIVDYVDKYIFDEELVLLGEDGAPFFDEYRPVAFLITEKIWANNHIHVIKGKQGICNRFLVHYLNSVEYREYINGSILNKLTQGNMNEIACPIPSTAEQEIIADFLDAQCTKIDSVIADIEKQIETLQKYKKSLITEVVTKGLDCSVPMKNSGIEWAQHIPAHWQTTRMQEIGRYKKGPFGSTITLDMFIEKDETAVKIYEQKNVIQADATLGWYYISQRDFAALTDFEVFPGDIIVSCAGTIGKCYIMPETMEKGIINQALMKITLSSNVDRNYFLSLFDVALEYMADKYSNGSAIKNIPPFSVLKKQHIPLPSIEEQKEIASYISQKSELLDRLIEEKKQQLQVMQDHKKSLIYEYVTGKKRVAEAN